MHFCIYICLYCIFSNSKIQSYPSSLPSNSQHFRYTAHQTWLGIHPTPQKQTSDQQRLGDLSDKNHCQCEQGLTKLIQASFHLSFDSSRSKRLTEHSPQDTTQPRYLHLPLHHLCYIHYCRCYRRFTHQHSVACVTAIALCACVCGHAGTQRDRDRWCDDRGLVWCEYLRQCLLTQSSLCLTHSHHALVNYHYRCIHTHLRSETVCCVCVCVCVCMCITFHFFL